MVTLTGTGTKNIVMKYIHERSTTDTHTQHQRRSSLIDQVVIPQRTALAVGEAPQRAEVMGQVCASTACRDRKPHLQLLHMPSYHTPLHVLKEVEHR